jgi:hypothetical protein
MAARSPGGRARAKSLRVIFRKEPRMNRTTGLAVLMLAVGTLGVLGCLDVDARAPDIYLDRGSKPPPVDSSRVPPTASHEEARAELQKAYQNIQYLEDENRRLHEKVEKEKDRGDEYKDKYNKLKDKYED